MRLKSIDDRMINEYEAVSFEAWCLHKVLSYRYKHALYKLVLIRQLWLKGLY
jgi:hypothetical protein